VTIAHKLADRPSLKWIHDQTIDHHLPILEKPLEDLKESVFVARAEGSLQNGPDIVFTMMGQHVFEPENRMRVGEQMIEEALGP
jgi:hypothetical protein